MGRKLYIAVVLLVVLLLAGRSLRTRGKSRSDEIAEGITIGGVNVGGMTEEEAPTPFREACGAAGEEVTVNDKGASTS